jgi:hypothetical protein
MPDPESLKTQPYLVGSKIRKINVHVGSFVKIESTGILLIRLQMIPNEIDIASYVATKKQEMLGLEQAFGFNETDNDPYYNPHIPSETVKYTNTHIIDFVGLKLSVYDQVKMTFLNLELSVADLEGKLDLEGDLTEYFVHFLTFAKMRNFMY